MFKVLQKILLKETRGALIEDGTRSGESRAVAAVTLFLSNTDTKPQKRRAVVMLERETLTPAGQDWEQRAGVID